MTGEAAWQWPDGYTPVTVREAIQILDRTQPPELADGMAANLELGYFEPGVGADGGLHFHVTPAGERAMRAMVARREGA